eukprot:CAMPEP_0171484442 /NCGR_PEP_ID=MMETSP0958-20121227/6_1 /TAXON_ID=87120 /ORGANISM="Aurantiochytrium limacinum, Strain ATCCMYA-1381" /LENGTH=319 /DNA_ID=CAMNT_0012017149 /DNA_START=384 /DNA_END=1344 /DNA_ORIENTATION=-
MGEKYVLGRPLGGGTFGAVFVAQRKSDECLVAVKKVGLSATDWVPSAAMREVLSLRLAGRHGNVVELLDVYAHGLSMCLVMELAEVDLDELIEANSGLELSRDEAVVKYLTREILQGLNYLHGLGIMHRDVKPSNKYIALEDGRVKLGDFGLARSFRYQDGRTYSHQIMTRWFRAPEVLFGSRRYDATVDVWAVGVIIATFANHCKTVFPGDNDIDQISCIAEIIGSHPWTAENIAFVPDVDKLIFPKRKRVFLEKFSKQNLASPALLKLADEILQYENRPSAQECLGNECFKTGPLPSFAFKAMIWPRSKTKEAARGT